MEEIIKKTKRIEYIDAMRGFTMLLVVINHVSVYCLGFYGSSTFRISDIFAEFRMPLFFFVSGFVLYKADALWNVKNSLKFLKKKLTVQIISPLIFWFCFILLTGGNFMRSITSCAKSGYWFTFALFEFFIMYIILYFIIEGCRLKKYEDWVLVIGGFLVYASTIYALKVTHYSLDKGWSGLIGIYNFYYFLYFIFGNRVRKYFVNFQNLLDSKYFTLFCIVIFFGMNIFVRGKIGLSVFNLITAISGIIIVLAMFRANAEHFSSSKCLGRISQFIGRRTLDIYLLHYFFLKTNMNSILPDFSKLNSPLLAFVFSLILTTIVIASCIFVSMILRLNPTFGHFLFGAKIKDNDKHNNI